MSASAPISSAPRRRAGRRPGLPRTTIWLIVSVGLALVACRPPSAPTLPGTDGADRAPGPAVPGEPVLEPLGIATLPPGVEVEGYPLGGLSALAWDPAADAWLALSDDRARRGPARLYSLRLALGADGRLDDGDVEVTGVTELTAPGGLPFAAGTVDPEGLALTAGGTLLVASEGAADDGEPPAVWEAGADGSWRRAFEVPERFLPAARRGVRDNQAFESLTLSPDGPLLVAAEGPLRQDGPAAGLGWGGLVRIVRFDPVSGRPVAEHAYPLDPVPAPPVPPDGFAVAGLVELLALGDGEVLALERSYVAGRGFYLRLYRASLDGAGDVSGVDSLEDAGTAVVPVDKHLLLDLADLGAELGNVEGMALGPALADGRRLLVLVADDNFARDQRTRFLAFAVRPSRLAAAPPPSPAPSRIAAVQGAAHVSPLAGRDVVLEGVVTAVAGAGTGPAPPGGERGFWIADPVGDGDPATSEGLFVALGPAGEPPVGPGDAVRVSGRVLELGREGGLTVTALASAPHPASPDGRMEVLGREPVPAPVTLGEGRCPPGRTLDDDRLTRFEPASDGLDLWESLEGMPVALAAPTVVGPTSRYGDLVLVAEGCAEAPRTARGGLLVRPGDFNPERLTAAPRLAPDPPPLAVGQRFLAPVTGVLDYDFTTYRLLPTAWPATGAGAVEPETTRVAASPGGGGVLTAATLNVENLSVRSDEEELAALVRTLVEGLGSPALVALQEVQDDSGAVDDGVVTSAATVERLLAAVMAAGGPAYEARWIDPEDGADGGRPGANIRNVLLADPERVTPVDRGAAGPADPVHPARGPDGPRLSHSPGRLAPGHPAFRGSRKPLVVELAAGGRPLFAVVVHLSSKWGDDALAGPWQPPRRPSDAARLEQARLVADFAAGLLAADPRARVLVLGDCNDFPFRSTLAPLTAAGLENLVLRLPLADRYTYVYRGNSQVLDHLFASPALADALTAVDAVHRHADFPASARPSDHDPVVAGFALGGER